MGTRLDHAAYEQLKTDLKALNELAPEMRFQLAHAVKMRHVPELHFHYDDSVDRGERIDNLLRESPDAATGEAGGADDVAAEALAERTLGQRAGISGGLRAL